MAAHHCSPGHDTFRGTPRLNAVTSEDAADLALLPIEDTAARQHQPVYDLLAAGGAAYVWRGRQRTDRALLARRLPGVALDGLRVVLSHPQALAQCDALFLAHPHLTARAAIDTAGSAQRVRDAGDRTLAAIASAAAAKRYGLEIVARTR